MIDAQKTYMDAWKEITEYDVDSLSELSITKMPELSPKEWRVLADGKDIGFIDQTTPALFDLAVMVERRGYSQCELREGKFKIGYLK